MAQVYLLTEDDSDDQIYLYVLETLTGARFDAIPLRLRRGGGVGEVRKKLPLLAAHIRNTGPLDDVYFVVAIDNDRALEHPDHTTRAHSTAEACRLCTLTDVVSELLPDGQPVPGAVAVPVQMIEAWVLLMTDASKYPSEAELPPFGQKTQSAAQRHYGGTPPPQLKDLVEIEFRASGEASKDDFALRGILALNPGDLARRCPSFERFRVAVSQWGVRLTT